MASKKHDRIRLGVSTLVWGPDLSAQDKMERFLGEASEIGYEGMLPFEVSVMPWVDRPADFRKLLDRYRMDLAGVILRPTIDFGTTDRLTKFMAAVGGEVMNISGRDGTKAEWDIVIPALQRHAEIAHKNGVRAVYQHHTGWIAETMEDYERLLADTDRTYLGVMIDCGHATKDWPGHTAQEFILKHPEIDYIEFKDYSPASDLRTVVGRGLCDWPAVADAMRKIDYRGWLVVEQNGAFGHPRIGAAESFHYIRDVLRLGR
ncbi:MAG: TIM barrel protein [Chloroflexi bacterium]|nr:TIM barrel protein [Chloroflexota bacterium]